MTGLRELVEDVYDVQLGGTTRDGRTMYVGAFVLTNGPTTLVDTGWPDTTDELLSALAEGVDELDRVFVTHDGHDHWGGLDAVCDRYDPQVFVPVETDLPATLNTDPDVRFADGDAFAGCVEVVRTPGHTTAASSLYLRDQRALIAADSLDGSGPPGTAAGLPAAAAGAVQRRPRGRRDEPRTTARVRHRSVRLPGEPRRGRRGREARTTRRVRRPLPAALGRRPDRRGGEIGLRRREPDAASVSTRPPIPDY